VSRKTLTIITYKPKLTVKGINSLQPREKIYEIRDGNGFGLRIYPSRNKHFSLMSSSALPLSQTNHDELATLLRLSHIINFVKSLQKDRINLPTPRPFSNLDISAYSERTARGLLLLS